MEFTIKAGSPEKLKNGCVVAGVFAGGELSTAAKALDKASDGSIAAILSRGDLDDKAGATLTLHALPGLATPRVLLVSLGKADELTDKTYRDAVSAAARQLAGSPADDAAFCLADVDLPCRDAAWRIAQAAQILKDSTYRCDELKSKKDESKKGVKKLVFITRGKPAADLDAALREGEAIAEGMALAKTLGNLPGNVCTPGYLAATARKLAKDHKIKVEILERADMEKLGRFFEHAFFLSITFENTRDGTTETRYVRTSFDRINIIYITENMFLVAGIIDHGYFNRYIAFFIIAFTINGFGYERLTVAVFVEIFNKLNNASFAIESFRVGVTVIVCFTHIAQRDANAFIQVSQFF